MYSITIKQHIYLEESHKKTYLVNAHRTKHLNCCLFSRWYWTWSITPIGHEGKTNSDFCIHKNKALPQRKEQWCLHRGNSWDGVPVTHGLRISLLISKVVWPYFVNWPNLAAFCWWYGIMWPYSVIETACWNFPNSSRMHFPWLSSIEESSLQKFHTYFSFKF